VQCKTFQQVISVPRSRKPGPKVSKKEDSDLSFPVPYQEHAKYIQLANDFLASGIDPRSDNVIPIDRDHPIENGKPKKVA